MINKILIALFILINLVAFLRVGFDKDFSQNGAYGTMANINHRISEVSIITYAAWGGAIGTAIGFKFFNHKTSDRKRYLTQSVNALIIQNVIFVLSLFIIINICFKKRKKDELKEVKKLDKK